MVESIPVSVMILTKDEEASLPACLASLQRFDDVTVVDSKSSNATVQIARQAGVNVVEFDWNQQYPKKKQWSLDHVPRKYRHVMLLDADERVNTDLAAEMAEIDWAEAATAAYDVQLDYVFLRRRLRFGHKVHKRIIIDPERCHFPIVADLDVTNMWEVEGHYQPTVVGEVRRLNSPLLHDDRDPLFDYFSRHNRYSDWEAQLADSSRATTAAARSKGGRIFYRLPGKPLAFFLYAYIIRSGSDLLK